MARILVVDDSVENLTLIGLFLRATEFEVVTATTGREALDLAAAGRFELILLDVAMPGIDGFEVCRRLKNDPLTAFVPVIFLTGRLADESEKVAAYRLGAVDYIQKPVTRDELVARIRVMLSLEQTRSRLERENVTLRERVEGLDRELDEVRREIGDLQALRRAFDASADPWLVVVDPDGRVTAADLAGDHPLDAIRTGAQLVDSGVLGARLTQLAAGGVQVATLSVPAADGAARSLRVTIRQTPEGGAVLLVREVTAVEQAELKLHDREVARFADAVVRPELRGYAMTDFIGRAPAVAELNDAVDRLRQSRSTVLVRGETGTGKELVARALHFDGVNRGAPFIPLHCGAIAPELVESELFGHEKGAFTGAQQSRDGLFCAADGGTVFLDEVAEMSKAVQVKLLRVLQRGEVRPVGSNQLRIVDVRIIAATNRDLAEMVRLGKFREDLYYRLQVVQLDLPSLRDRIEDLPLLLEHFLQRANVRHGRKARPVTGATRGALEHLMAYSWPGNVRELEHIVEGAFALGCGEVLQVEDLPEHVLLGRPSFDPAALRRFASGVGGGAAGDEGEQIPDFRELRRKSERQAILRALQQTGGDKIAAAHLLGMSRSTLYRRLRSSGS